MPLPECPALSRRDNRSRICPDCAAAEALADRLRVLDDGMARTAVSNEREEALRLPGAPFFGVMRFNTQARDLDDLIAWRERHGLFEDDQ